MRVYQDIHLKLKNKIEKYRYDQNKYKVLKNIRFICEIALPFVCLHRIIIYN